jgi:hypothetical protein
MELDWLKKVRTMSSETRMGWIDREAELALARQCELSGVARATFYGRKVLSEESEGKLLLCRLIDEEYTRRPFYASRRMVVYLARQGHAVNRKRVQRLMRLAGMALGPTTSVKPPDHCVHPDLLRGVEVTRPNQVWSTDMTYFRMPVTDTQRRSSGARRLRRVPLERSVRHDG